MKATRIHYFYANDWPIKIWLTGFTILFGVGAMIEGWPLLDSPFKWTNQFYFFGLVVLAALLGWFAGILVGWPVIGPLYYNQSQKNGEPFHKGDRVQILVGPHRDRVVQVIETFEIGAFAGAHRIRVDLGEKPEKAENVFTSSKILRVSG